MRRFERDNDEIDNKNMKYIYLYILLSFLYANKTMQNTSLNNCTIIPQIYWNNSMIQRSDTWFIINK